MADSFQIAPEQLLKQAQTAYNAGFTQLAENLRRAAELTTVPNEVLLKMYEFLRPGRSTHAELIAIAEALEQEYNAIETAAFVREAADVYLARGLFRRE
jgi:propanediol dehydratase small subunit